MNKKPKRKSLRRSLWGRIGGRATTKAKRLAAIANGKKGGRPREYPDNSPRDWEEQ